MVVYVLNKDRQPLMPTERCGKVRRLLKQNEAKVINRCPFTNTSAESPPLQAWDGQHKNIKNNVYVDIENIHIL